MHQHRSARVVVTVVAALLLPVLSSAAQTPADNTKINKRDRAKGAVTADQQKENATDREITQKIRRALMDDKMLSTYAHNVKIVTAGRTGHAEGTGPNRGREEDRGNQSHGSGRRRARHQSDQHRPGEELEEVTKEIT